MTRLRSIAVLAAQSRGLPGLRALVAGLVFLCAVAAHRVEAQPLSEGFPPAAESDAAMDSSFGPSDDWEGPRADDFVDLSAPPADVPCGPADGCAAPCGGPFLFDWEPVTYLGLRHSSTHGRNVGRGKPLVGTSWLNRPYFAGAALGEMWQTRRVEDSVGRDVDVFGYFFAGWDWDHYWGSEVQVGWATPEQINGHHPHALRSDRMSLWSFSHLYYPWGDSLVRPYWRCGIGNTEVSFPNDDGITGRHETLLTFPLGFGVKYPVRRWLAARAEVTDYLSLGEYGVATQNDIALTFSLEFHGGAHPRSYWPWNPSRHIW